MPVLYGALPAKYLIYGGMGEGGLVMRKRGAIIVGCSGDDRRQLAAVLTRIQYKKAEKL